MNGTGPRATASRSKSSVRHLSTQPLFRIELWPSSRDSTQRRPPSSTHHHTNPNCRLTELMNRDVRPNPQDAQARRRRDARLQGHQAGPDAGAVLAGRGRAADRHHVAVTLNGTSYTLQPHLKPTMRLLKSLVRCEMGGGRFHVPTD